MDRSYQEIKSSDVNKKLISNCRTDKDHIWKQVGESETVSDTIWEIGHPESSFGYPIYYTEVAFECQNCGIQKTLKR